MKESNKPFPLPFLYQGFIPASVFYPSISQISLNTDHCLTPWSSVLLKVSPWYVYCYYSTSRPEKEHGSLFHCLSQNHTGSWSKAGNTLHSNSLMARRFLFKALDKPYPIHPHNLLVREINTKYQSLLRNLVMKRPLTNSVQFECQQEKERGVKRCRRVSIGMILDREGAQLDW